MMTVRLTGFALMLFCLIGIARLLSAHDGHGHHVLGTLTALHDHQMVVMTTSGRTATIQLDRTTRYRTASGATSREMLQPGDRVVVDVTVEANGLRAAELRYAPMAPHQP